MQIFIHSLVILRVNGEENFSWIKEKKSKSIKVQKSALPKPKGLINTGFSKETTLLAHSFVLDNYLNKVKKICLNQLFR